MHDAQTEIGYFKNQSENYTTTQRRLGMDVESIHAILIVILNKIIR